MPKFTGETGEKEADVKYKAILFDMDGTVLDTLRDLNAAVNCCMEHFGCPLQTIDETRRRVGNGSRRLIELSVPDGTSKEKIGEMLAWYLPYYNDHANDTTAPYPGIPALMERLRDKGCALAIVSNKPDRTVKELAAIHFPGLLETAVGENEAAGIRRKPWPDTLLAAAKELGVPTEKCLYVGDSEVDVLTAARAGMDCASVLWGFRSREEIAAAGGTLFINDPGELLDYIVTELTE